MRFSLIAVGRLRPPYQDDVQHYQKLLAVGVQQHDHRLAGQAPRDRPGLGHLHHLDPRVAGQQAQVVLGVVREGRAQAPDGEDGPLHSLR